MNTLSGGSIVFGDGATPQTLTVTPGTIGGQPFTHASGAVIDMEDGAGGDVLNVTGDLVLNGAVNLDVDLSRPAHTNSVDQIIATGTVSGNTTLAFQNIDPGTTVDLGSAVTVVRGSDTSGLTANATGLPTDGAFIYTLNNTGTEYQLTSSANSALGNLAAGFGATQALIATVVNRPSSAFVRRLSNSDDDSCAIGTWSRTSLGRAEANLKASSDAGTFQNEIGLNYRGLQVGLDRSCAGSYFNGWDLTYGATLGVNSGGTKLPIVQPLSNSVITSDFGQTFAGLYVSAAKGNWSGDVQFSMDRTSYDIQESIQSGTGIGVISQTVESRGKKLSGSSSYSHTLDQELNLRIVPTVGFSFAEIETDAVKVNSGGTAAELRTSDIQQKIGFIGASLTRTQVRPSGNTTLTYFATGTYFNDFGDEVESTLVQLGSGGQSKVNGENLSGFGELSLGLNYTSVLNAGSALPARQLDASIRVDTRFSDQLDSWGLTAQFRLQF